MKHTIESLRQRYPDGEGDRTVARASKDFVWVRRRVFTYVWQCRTCERVSSLPTKDDLVRSVVGHLGLIHDVALAKDEFP